MNVATIVPTPYLELTKKDGFFMALAHLIVPGEPYAEFFRARSAEGCYIICDNGAAEKAQLPWPEVIARAQYIKASEVILPDTIYDSVKTVEASYAALQEARHLPFKLMAVPQGATFLEWCMCATFMLTWPVNCIGISKFMTARLGTHAREEALQALAALDKRNKSIHLLGCWSDPSEPNRLAKRHRIRSVDSAIAYAFARKGEMLSFDRPSPAVEINFEDANTEQERLAQNIKVWKDWCLYGL